MYGDECDDRCAIGRGHGRPQAWRARELIYIICIIPRPPPPSASGPMPVFGPQGGRKGDTVPLWQGKSKKKSSGGRLYRSRGKRRFEIGRDANLAVLGPPAKHAIRTRGANSKIFILSDQEVSVSDPRTHKAQKVRILNVVENPANPHYVRRNIITKGTMVETDLGRVRITSRPGQHGVINGVLVAKK